MTVGVMILALGLARADEAGRAAMRAALAEMRAANAELVDASYLFYKQERIGGVLGPIEPIDVKFRKPFDLYMRWKTGDKAGREIAYRQGHNNGQMRVATGGWMPTLDIDPRGRLATRGNRHDIFAVGFNFPIDRTTEDAQRLDANPALVWDAIALGPKQIYNTPARCFQIELPKHDDPALYTERVVMCQSLRTRMPARVEAWEHTASGWQMMERYDFTDVQINTGLTDADFTL